MEGAGKLVEDEELREAMQDKGLGTPATRAAIIEGLIWEKYVLRNGRELQPTAKAFSIITLLRGLGIPELSSPELTGDWEFKLRRMARGQMKRDEFMKEIAAMTRDIVQKAKRHESDTVPGDFGTLKVPCPKCGGEIHENYKKFQCQKCDFSLWKIVASRQLEIPEVEELIAKRQVGPLQGFRSKMGKPFAATIKLTPELKPEFDFGQDRPDANGVVAEVDFTGQEPLGKCPKCGQRVFETAMVLRLRESDRGRAHLRFPLRESDSCSSPSNARRCRSSSPPARPTCCQSSSRRRAGLSKPSSCSRTAASVSSSSRARPRQRKMRAKSAEPKEPAPKLDFTGQEPLGKCPKCGGKVYEAEAAFVCERSQAEKRACKFKISKMILQQAIDRAQAAQAAGREQIGPAQAVHLQGGPPIPSLAGDG